MNEIRDDFWKQVEPEHLKARAFCRKLMGNRDDGDDLYQDCLIHALSKYEHLRDKAAFRPWLYRLIVNSFKNRIKSPWWKRALPFTSEDTISAGNDPSAAHMAKFRLEKAFKAVSPDDRALITLFEMHGWKISEIAEMTGHTEGAIKVRLSRTRQKMRKTLTDYLKRSGSTVHELLTKDEICVVSRSAKD